MLHKLLFIHRLRKTAILVNLQLGLIKCRLNGQIFPCCGKFYRDDVKDGYLVI